MRPADLAYGADGLVPVVVQEADTGDVLTVAWMSREALEATLRTGVTHFWSRSRKTLWRKGETSGHTQHVTRIRVDCDADTLLVQVHQDGAACHTGERTCFFRALEVGTGPACRPDQVAGAPGPTTEGGETAGVPPATMLESLERIVASRRDGAPPGSYVAGLLAKGETVVCQKVGEEAVEVITAALGGAGDARVVEEIADLWFHTIVLLGHRRIPLRSVVEELARRHRRRQAPEAPERG